MYCTFLLLLKQVVCNTPEVTDRDLETEDPALQPPSECEYDSYQDANEELASEEVDDMEGNTGKYL
jgi:hypothetical protein